LRYVYFIRDEKVKIKRYICGQPPFYASKLKYDEPKTIEETLREEKQIYEHTKNRIAL